MSQTIVADLDLWLASIAVGACMAFAYDFLRLFRRLVRHGRFAVDVEDLLYWTLCFFVSFVLLYYGNNGVIRFVAVFGAALGMLLYVVTLGRIFIKVGYFLINKTIGSIFRFLRRILRKLHKMICSATRKNKEFLEKVGIFNKIRKIKRYLLTHFIFYNKIKKNRNIGKRDSVNHLDKKRSFLLDECADYGLKGERGSSHGRKGDTRRIKKRVKKKKDAGI